MSPHAKYGRPPYKRDRARADQLRARIFLIQDGKIKDVPGENVLDVGLGDDVLIQRTDGTLLP